MADGGAETDQPAQAVAQEADQARATADPGTVATGQRAEPAPETRTLRRFRPGRPRRQTAWLRSTQVAGALLSRLTVLPVVLLLAWLIPGLPLLLARAFQPTPMVLISVPLAI